jgi:hypothetical protein
VPPTRDSCRRASGCSLERDSSGTRSSSPLQHYVEDVPGESARAVKKIDARQYGGTESANEGAP